MVIDTHTHTAASLPCFFLRVFLPAFSSRLYLRAFALARHRLSLALLSSGHLSLSSLSMASYVFSRVSESHAHRHWTHMMRWMVLLWLPLEVPVAAASSLPLESEHFEAGRGLGQTFVAPSAFDTQLDFLDQQGLHGRKLSCVCACLSNPSFPYFIAPLKLTMLLGSCCGHLLLHHRAGLRTCLPFKLPTAQLHCPDEATLH